MKHSPERDASGLAQQWVGGLHAVKAILRADPGGVSEVRILQGRRDRRIQSLLQQARQVGLPIHSQTRVELDDAFGSGEHQGILACYAGRAPGPETALFEWLGRREGTGVVLALDELQDPHNLGACLRTADATGVDAVVVPQDNAVGLTPTVRKVASGAAETVRVFQVVNLPRALIRMQEQGFWVYGAAGEADKELHDLDFSGPSVLVMGAEGKGLRRLTRERCDVLFSIPMRGHVESLNVSVAAGVVLYEVLRQRAAS